jgi:hypothetical protein
MNQLTNASGYMPPNRKINEVSYKRALETLNEHFKIPCAPNSKYKSEDLNLALIYLTVENAYAESGLQNLACTQKAPSADTLLRRVKSLDPEDACKMLNQANDNIIKSLKHKGVFKKPVLAAADYSDDCWCGQDNVDVCKGPYSDGTNQFYRHASLHVLEDGKRVTVFTMMVLPRDSDEYVIETLVKAARASGIAIGTLLVDRGFDGTKVVNKLNELRQYFLTPAVKHQSVKDAIEAYDKGLICAVTNHVINGAKKNKAKCRLYIRMKKDALPTDPVINRYIAFLTNLSIEKVIFAYEWLPEEYRKRWGIENGFKLQDDVQAKTTSDNFSIRVVYTMLSTILYNIWVLANIVVAKRLHIEPKKPIIKLRQLTHYFSRRLEQLYKPP